MPKVIRQNYQPLVNNGTMMLLPPRADSCQICATEHEPELPHNKDSLYYQMAFTMQNPGKWPTWADAMQHCTSQMREDWTRLLLEKGQEVGEVTAPTPRGTA
jgi:hypothetical protein